MSGHESAAQGRDGVCSQVLRAELRIGQTASVTSLFYQRDRYRCKAAKVFTSECDDWSDNGEYCLYDSATGASGLGEPSDCAVSDCP